MKKKGFLIIFLLFAFFLKAQMLGTPDFTKGFFMVNEDWFGHTDGSVNFIGNDGKIYYNVYSEANNNSTLGTTTEYATIYGGKFYFVSKQKGSGGRLVVADALTMKKIASFDNIGNADGRSFLGVNEHTGYIGTSNGIYIFDIDKMKIGSVIVGSGTGKKNNPYSAQIGNMIRTSQYVFAVRQSVGILVIDPNTNKLVNTVRGTFHSITQAKDGSVWAIQDQKLLSIDPVTFTTVEYNIPTTKYLGSWGAWNAGSLTYSNLENSLYWFISANSFIFGSKVVKFDVTNKTFNENFITIPGQVDEKGNSLEYKQFPYAAGLRIDPVSDHLIINTTESGFGDHYLKNWIYTYDNTGKLLDTKTLKDYYWFPAITVFPDNAPPVVSNTLPSMVSVNEKAVINLKDIVSDEDNLSSAIVKSIKSNSDPSVIKAEINKEDELILTPLTIGVSDIILSFNSNGKIAEKSIAVSSVAPGLLATEDTKKIKLNIYPNPTSDILHISLKDSIVDAVIYDISGKAFKKQVRNGQIDVRELPKGIYILKIISSNVVYQQKFIKQ